MIVKKFFNIFKSIAAFVVIWAVWAVTTILKNPDDSNFGYLLLVFGVILGVFVGRNLPDK